MQVLKVSVSFCQGELYDPSSIDTKLLDTLIVDTHGDLNIYKEMWQAEQTSRSGFPKPCCDRATVSNGEVMEETSDVDFNYWTGELIKGNKQYRYMANHISGDYL